MRGGGAGYRRSLTSVVLGSVRRKVYRRSGAGIDFSGSGLNSEHCLANAGPETTVSASTSSSVWESLRLGLSETDSQAGRPGAFRPSMAPGLGQWAVISVPSASTTSAKKRLLAAQEGDREEGRGEVHYGRYRQAGFRPVDFHWTLWCKRGDRLLLSFLGQIQ
jgi:hypothetical protein